MLQEWGLHHHANEDVRPPRDEEPLRLEGDIRVRGAQPAHPRMKGAYELPRQKLKALQQANSSLCPMVALSALVISD